MQKRLKILFEQKISLLIYCFIVFLLINTFFPLPSYAKIHHVTNVNEFRVALLEASNNGENDIIFVDRGDYLIDIYLGYTPAYSERDYSLFIGGLPWQKPVLDGQSRTTILNIEADYQQSDIFISDMIFQNGRYRTANGGAIPGGLKISTGYADIKVANSVFLNNHIGRASWGGGGAYLRSGRGIISFFNNIFSGNEADGDNSAGGVKIDATNSVLFINNTIINNTGWVGGAYIKWSSSQNGLRNRGSSIVNNIVRNNIGRASSDKSDIYILAEINDDDCPFFMIERNNRIEGNSSLGIPRSFALPLSSCHPYSFSHNIHEDPMLTPEFELLSSSPCIDRGHYLSRFFRRAPIFDHLGHNRSIDGNLDCTFEPDIGAIEYVPPDSGSVICPMHYGQQISILPAKPVGGIPTNKKIVYLPITEIISNSNISVGWTLSTHRTFSKSSSYSLYYGNPHKRNYNTGQIPNHGTVKIPSVRVPVNKKPFLSFMLYIDTEEGSKKDALRVFVGKDKIWEKTSKNVQMKKWQKINIDLSLYKDQTIDVAFEFHTINTTANDSEGVYIDDIIIGKSMNDMVHIPF